MSLAQAMRAQKSASQERDGTDSAVCSDDGAGDQVTIRISFNSSTPHPNDIGQVSLRFREQAMLTNLGFFAGMPPQTWQPGQILGKADDYVWPINNEMQQA